MDDWELLQQYRTTGSDEAFRALVERHLGLVYATALRRLNGDAHLAQDVAQLVFTNLARKASQLGPGSVLPGWLHRDTCFTTLEVLRRERRRHAREYAALSMQATEHESTAPDWEQICPWLDEALNQLPAKDRDALLLRFFEQRSLGEIGQRLGFGESGASRRVTRALEKLRGLLVARGVATTSAALSGVLLTHAAQAAPAGLAAPLAAASLTAALGSTINTVGIGIMTSIKLKIGLAAAVLGTALLIPIALKHHARAQSSAAAELRDLEREHLQEAGQHLLGVIRYAGDHQNQVPRSLEEAGVPADDFELVYQGPLPAELTELSSTIILREKRPWPNPKGGWAKAYGYADGHSQVNKSADGNFSQWDRSVSPLPPIAARNGN